MTRIPHESRDPVKGNESRPSTQRGDRTSEIPTDSSSLTRYLTDIREFSRMSEDEDRLPRRGLADDTSAEPERLVHSALNFVLSIAREYRGLGLSFEDLVGEGNVGLMEAALRFDATRGTKFTTYAIFWVRRAILGALSAKARVIRSPTHFMNKIQAIRDAENELRKALGRRPTREELSNRLSITLKQLDKALSAETRAINLSDRAGWDGSRTLEDRLRDPNQMTPEDRLIRREMKTLLDEAVSRLTEIQQVILERRFGLRGDPVETLDTLGRRLGLSRERVRQIEVEAKRRVRRHLAKRSSPLRRAL